MICILPKKLWGLVLRLQKTIELLSRQKTKRQSQNMFALFQNK